MAKQLFLCPVIGDGLTTETAFRPSLADQVRGGSFVGALTCRLPLNPSNGLPLKSWCLCLVAARDLTTLYTLPNVFPLLQATPQTKVSSIRRKDISDLIAKLISLGVDVKFLNGSESEKVSEWGEVVRSIGRAADDVAFQEDKFDRPDVT